MFGTIARVTVQPGREDEFLAIGDQWTRERGEQTGQVAEYLFKTATPAQYFLVAIFRDRDAYYANAADPETDGWYRRMRATLEADPEWHDGEVMHAQQLSEI